MARKNEGTRHALRLGALFGHTHHIQMLQPQKGKGFIAVPAYVGSLAAVKTVPVTKPVRAGEQEQNI
eukprot:1105942-Pelagomonas_calceolata.AAC.5